MSFLASGCNDNPSVLGKDSDAKSIDGSDVKGSGKPNNKDSLVYDVTSHSWIEKQMTVDDVSGLNSELNTTNLKSDTNKAELQNNINQKVDSTQYITDKDLTNTQVQQKLSISGYNIDKAAADNESLSLQNQINQKSDQVAVSSALSLKLDKTGGKLTGDLQLNNKNANQETTTSATMTAADAGKSWFNSAIGKMKFWNGTQAKEVATVDEVAKKATSTDLGTLAYKSTIIDSDVSGVSGGKVSGDISGKSAGINNNINENQVNNLQSDLNSKLNNSGGALTGDLQFNQKDSSTETLQTSSLTVTDQAKVWFNSTISKLKVWSGATVQSIATDDEVATKADSSSLGFLAYKNTVGDANITSVASSKITGQVSDSQVQGVSGAKISGDILGNAAGITNNILTSQITNLSSFISNLVNIGTQIRTTGQTSSSISLLNTDAEFLAVDTSSSPVTVTLPSTPTAGRVFKIKDSSGNANVNNVTIVGNGNNIDGKTSSVISVQYGNLDLVYSGQWLISYSSPVKKAPTRIRLTYGSGAYVPSANVLYIKVRMVGGGGGGGAGINQWNGGGGGGSGGYIEGTIYSLNTAYYYSIAGGGGPGGGGGNTSFADSACYGGGGGSQDEGASSGGSFTLGSVFSSGFGVQGSGGSSGGSGPNYGSSGAGGTTPFGGAGGGGRNPTSGAGNSGSGGGGGMGYGSYGGSGVVDIEEFY